MICVKHCPLLMIYILFCVYLTWCFAYIQGKNASLGVHDFQSKTDVKLVVGSWHPPKKPQMIWIAWWRCEASALENDKRKKNDNVRKNNLIGVGVFTQPHLVVSINGEPPNRCLISWKIPLKWMILWYPPTFQETSIYINIYIYIYLICIILHIYAVCIICFTIYIYIMYIYIYICKCMYIYIYM